MRRAGGPGPSNSINFTEKERDEGSNGMMRSEANKEAKSLSPHY